MDGVTMVKCLLIAHEHGQKTDRLFAWHKSKRNCQFADTLYVSFCTQLVSLLYEPPELELTVTMYDKLQTCVSVFCRQHVSPM